MALRAALFVHPSSDICRCTTCGAAVAKWIGLRRDRVAALRESSVGSLGRAVHFLAVFWKNVVNCALLCECGLGEVCAVLYWTVPEEGSSVGTPGEGEMSRSRLLTSQGLPAARSINWIFRRRWP